MSSVSRREVICLLGSATSFSVLSGCLSKSSPTGVSASDISVKRGQTAKISVQAENIRMIGFGDDWETTELVEYDLDGVSPHPDEGLDSHPPYWIWDKTQARVKLELPVTPAPDLEPGTYEWTVRVWKGEKTRKPANATTTAIIEVT